MKLSSRSSRLSFGARGGRARSIAAFVALLALGTAAFTATSTIASRAFAQAHGAPHGGDHPGGAQSGEHRADPSEEHAQHGGGHGHGPAPINWTNIWDKKSPAFIGLVINFGVLVTLYYVLGKKPVAEALKKRRITIGKDIDEAQKLLEEAQERAKKYQGDLKNADADAATAKAALIASGKGEVDRLMLDATERSDRMKRDAVRLVEQERSQVRQDLLRETVDLAVQEATTMLGSAVTTADHTRLAEDLLAELARRPSAPKAHAASSSPAIQPATSAERGISS